MHSLSVRWHRSSFFVRRLVIVTRMSFIQKKLRIITLCMKFEMKLEVHFMRITANVYLLTVILKNVISFQVIV